jgi:CRP/FNR family transcriptional regulator, cyclic AMP receptor protein
MNDPLFSRFGRECPAGEVLFREGEMGDVMYVIQAGVVRVSKQLPGGERTLATFGRGEFVGEMAILNEKPRTATATVVEDAKVLVIEGTTLETMIAQNGEIAMRLIKKLAQRLAAADEFVQILLNPDPEARAILGILRHAESLMNGGEGEGDSVELRLTPEELAQDVGAKVDDVHDVLRRLGRLHIVAEGTGGRIVVVDIGRLLDFLEFLDVPRMTKATERA